MFQLMTRRFLLSIPFKCSKYHKLKPNGSPITTIVNIALHHCKINCIEIGEELQPRCRMAIGVRAYRVTLKGGQTLNEKEHAMVTPNPSLP